MSDEYIMKKLAQLIYERCNEWYKDPEHRKEFDEWHLKEYGVPHSWTGE